jgi:hypothetical protein
MQSSNKRAWLARCLAAAAGARGRVAATIMALLLLLLARGATVLPPLPQVQQWLGASASGPSAPASAVGAQLESERGAEEREQRDQLTGAKAEVRAACGEAQRAAAAAAAAELALAVREVGEVGVGGWL